MTLALIDALYKLSGDREAVDRALDNAIMNGVAKNLGIDLADLERKASELCEWGGPVIYYP